jgi:acyl-CoA thioesterase FadM
MDFKRNRKWLHKWAIYLVIPAFAMFFFAFSGKRNALTIHSKIQPVIVKSYFLPNTVFETSGLVYFNDQIWTFNDSGGEPELYAFSLPDTSQVRRATLLNGYNFDWEDITQDSSYVYAGDIGNNFGNRSNLCIYKIRKSILLKHKNSAPKAEKISFTYPGYEPVSLFSFTKSAFDCESIIYNNDSIYLFTKDWITLNSTVYVIPSRPGKYTARKIREFSSDGLITAADFAGGKLYLLGYKDGKVFMWLFSSLQGFLDNTDTGERIPLTILGGAQAEGLTIKNDSTLFISAEGGSLPARLWEIRLKNRLIKDQMEIENSALFRNVLPIQVRFSDVDIMGHVSNTVYQNYFDSGKVNYFDEVLPDMDFNTIGVVGASVKIDYLKPIFMKTPILVKTRVAVLGHKSLTMEHLLVHEQTGEVLSTCVAVLVCYAIKEQLSLPVPEHWRENILVYDQGVIEK